MTEENNLKLLKIESQRAQTFLFKVPRLADMDGANALLGDLFRQRIPKALERYLVPAPMTETALKTLQTAFESGAEADPVANSGGSLSRADDPVAAFRAGILVRDGGRFWGLVKPSNVEEAKAAAAAAIAEHCPGLGYAFHVGDLDAQDAPEDTPSESATDLVALPCFRWAEDGGDEPASGPIDHWQEDGTKETRYVSRATLEKRKARKSREALWDIASLLKEKGEIPAPTDGSDKVDFSQIAANKYLAVIHMDGNGVGQRSMEHSKSIKEEDFISRQAAMEKFFFGMRSAMRAAVASALKEQFEDAPGHYRLLMLGGDDVLIVCRADRALPLVTSVARELGGYALADDNSPLTIGAGVAIGKPKLPFHRLHELAEQLASSAKRIAVGPDDKRRSVVDWLVTTSSWVDSIDAHRSRWDRIQYAVQGKPETLLLTGKPYPLLEEAVSGEGDAGPTETEPSLEALLDFSAKLRKKFYEPGSGEEGVRSQLKHFLAELRKGRTYAELAWAELPEPIRRFFSDYAPPGLPAPASDGKGLWHGLGGALYRAWIADAIELVELQQIGRQGEDKNTEETPNADDQGAAA
jgi:hypothetical protein